MAVAQQKQTVRIFKLNKLHKALIIFFLILVFFRPSLVFADYVLPYPSSMPGSSLYKINLIKEKILHYWYFGNFGQFFYNLKEADKYLVEAKTLFEYKQYLLGYKALKKSDDFFIKTLPYLLKATSEGKDASENRNTLKQAAVKHKEVLIKLKQEVPANFTWIPEKSQPTELNFEDTLNQSIKIREKYL